MWGATVVLVTAIIIAWWEIPHLVHLGYYRELVVFSLLLLLAATAGVLKVLGVAMPNPGDWVLAVLSPFGEFLQRLFH
ncbi:hypothetical protein [Brevibacillus agri]|uniref:hypothetical protein n=1 Tax=Brevibacillus agri TaxID=51101 RepID=UPI003D229EC3